MSTEEALPRRNLLKSLVIAAVALVVVLGFLFALAGLDFSPGELDIFPTVDSGDTSISWSPNGRHIVVARGEGDGQALYQLNSDGGDPRRLTSFAAAADDPAVSPDGKRITYAAIPGAWDELYVADADGSNAKRLTDGDAVEGDPAWSPNGNEIAFVRGYDLDLQSELYVMRADGTRVRPLTSGSDVEETPSWSPDGAWIAYEAYPGVYVIPTHGHGRRRLVTSGLASPVWSPDGRRLAVVDNSTKIKVVTVGTREVRRLDVSRPLGPDEIPSAPDDLAWSPDGSEIAYTLGGSLYRVRVADGTIHRLTHCVDGGDVRCGA